MIGDKWFANAPADLPEFEHPQHIHSFMEPEERMLLRRALASVPPEYDTVEIGTLFGGSAYYGALRARDCGRPTARHWCIDQWGHGWDRERGAQWMQVAFAGLASEGLHNWCCWLPLRSQELLGVAAGWSLTSPCGLALIDGTHTAEAFGIDLESLHFRSVTPLLLVHDVDSPDYPEDPAYRAYSEEVHRVTSERGYVLLSRSYSLNVYGA